MGKKTVRGHDIANRFVYSLKRGHKAPSSDVADRIRRTDFYLS